MGWAAAAPWLASLGATGLSMFGNKSKSNTNQLANFSPEQQGLLNQIIQMLDIKGLDLGNNPLFQEGSDQIMQMLQGDTSLIEAPLMQQYEQEILPGIAQRFGGLGAQSSSGYQNALASAGGNLAGQLGQLRYGAKQSALDKALQYAGMRQQGLSNLAGLGMNAKPFGYETQAPRMGLFDALGYAGGQGLGYGMQSLFQPKQQQTSKPPLPTV